MCARRRAANREQRDHEPRRRREGKVWQAARLACRPAGENISLLMQSASKVVKDDADVREFRYFMSKQQAVQLGNYLYRVAGETAPVRPKRGLLDRLFGS